jgi:hypothetical protein
MAKVHYNNWNAITYAKNWCVKQDNACGSYLQGDGKSDCAHFLSHCLDAGGITIPDVDNTGLCPQGLAVRNAVLLPGLRNLAIVYDNVVEIGLVDAIIGDVGFLDIVWPTHGFMICEPFNLGDPLQAPKVYAHSNNRCCERLDTQWRQWFTTMFRLTDG